MDHPLAVRVAQASRTNVISNWTTELGTLEGVTGRRGELSFEFDAIDVSTKYNCSEVAEAPKYTVTYLSIGFLYTYVYLYPDPNGPELIH